MAKAAAKTGVDDYLAAGGTVRELRLLARRFEPREIGELRLSRDDKHRAAVEDLWRMWRALPARRQGECTLRSAVRTLIDEATKSGKPADGGLRVIMGMRTLAERTRIGLESATKAIDRAEDAGILRRDYWGRKRDKPGAFVLLVGRALPEHNGGKGTPEREEGREGEGFSPLSDAPSDRGVRVTRAPSDGVPELRWPKVIHEWERKDGKRRVVDSFYVARPGKKRGEIIRYLREVGGSASIAELLEKFGSKSTRARDFKRRALGPIAEDGVIAVEGETVSLSDDWRAALERVRTRGNEQADNRLQSERYAREREAFRKARTDGHPADPTPELAGPERTREIFAAAKRRDEVARLEEQRRKAGVTVEVFIHDKLQELGSIRMGLLRDLWLDRGGNPSHIWQAVRRMRCRLAKLPEYGNDLFVFPPQAEQEPAAVVPITPDTVGTLEELEDLTKPVSGTSEATPIPPNLKKPVAEKPPGDWRSHPLDCECVECVSPMPTYATAWSAS